MSPEDRPDSKSIQLPTIVVVEMRDCGGWLKRRSASLRPCPIELFSIALPGHPGSFGFAIGLAVFSVCDDMHFYDGFLFLACE
jgi:hypothetical protein